MTTTNTLKIDGRMDCTAAEVRQGRQVRGYRVRIAWLPGADESFEVLEHFALFASHADAAAVAAKVARTRTIDLACWHWEASRCTPVGALQARPTAALENVARPPRSA